MQTVKALFLGKGNGRHQKLKTKTVNEEQGWMKKRGRGQEGRSIGGGPEKKNAKKRPA